MTQEIVEKLDAVMGMLTDMLNRIADIEKKVENEHIRGRLHALLKVGATIGLELSCIIHTIRKGETVC
jgi:hypothetical protein